MKKIHPQSFGLGLASGLLVLVLVIGGMHLFARPARGGFGGGGNGTPNISRMAQRFGMTEAEVQKELDSGKTMQQIAQEHGVTFGGGRNSGGGTLSASGNAGVGNGSSLSSSQP